MTLDTVSDQPVITAERFALRPVCAADAGPLRLYAGDERVARYTRSIPHPMPPGAIEGFIERALDPDRTEDVWVMEGTGQGLSGVLGVIALDRMERAQSEIGYWVAPAMWGTGIASEAVAALLAANPHAARTIFAEVFQDNPGSARVLTNAGFEYIGDAEAYSVARQAKVATWTYLRKMV
ncbi:MAG: GNAT family N-acetyltransferase [Rhodobacteraceae bacterium]|nr:GNAT family N-acetyltransferase [Paracoccaceae bacterium]